MNRSRPARDIRRPIRVERNDDAYPASIKAFFGERAPECIFLQGNPELLQRDSLGLFCSIKCPGSIILKTYDVAKALRDSGIPVIGGFHTPMEKECLALLLRGAQPIVICPARGLERIRLGPEIEEGVQAGRVLLVSMFGTAHRRARAELADQRNRFVAALAARIFVSHATPGGKTEALCREIITLGKPLFTIDAPENTNLLALGAKALTLEEVFVLGEEDSRQRERHG